jgi:lysophospholipid acyltransferase (LPLAT)-like uncharacterized protein
MVRLLDRVKLNIFSFLGYMVIWLLYLTVRKEFNVPKYSLKEQVIVTFWHGELLMEPFLYRWFKREGRVALMISDHKDGELLSHAMRLFGFEMIRGSSRKGAIKALKHAFKKADLGYDIAITPDGPKGPRWSVADGVVAIAQKKSMKIVTFNYLPDSYWQLKSWDKFVIPKPFTTIRFYASEPFSIEGLDTTEAKNIIKERLNQYAII